MEKGNLDLEQAELTIKHMQQAANSKRTRKRAAANAAAKAKKKGGGGGGGKREGQSPPTRSSKQNKAAAASIAVTAAVSLSPPKPYASPLQTEEQGREGTSSSGIGSPSASSYNTASQGVTNDTASFNSAAWAGTANSAGSTSSAPDSDQAGTHGGQRYGASGASTAVDRDHTAVSVSASTAVDSYHDAVPNRSKEGGGRRGRGATNVNRSAGGSGQVRERRRTQATAVAEVEGTEATGAQGPAEENGVGAPRSGSSPVSSPASQTVDRRGRSRSSVASAPPAATTPPGLADVDTPVGSQPTLHEDDTDDRLTADNQKDLQQQQHKQQHQERGSPWVDSGSGAGIKQQQEAEGGDVEKNGGATGRASGSNRPLEEGPPAEELASGVATKAAEKSASDADRKRETMEPPQQRESPRDGPKTDTDDGEGSVHDRGGQDGDTGGITISVAPPASPGASEVGEQQEEEGGEDRGEEEEEEAEEEEGEDDDDIISGDDSLGAGGEETVADSSVKKASRHASAAVKGLEESIKKTLGAMPGMDAAVKEQLSAALRTQARTRGRGTEGGIDYIGSWGVCRVVGRAGSGNSKWD